MGSSSKLTDAEIQQRIDRLTEAKLDALAEVVAGLEHEPKCATKSVWCAHCGQSANGYLHRTDTLMSHKFQQKTDCNCILSSIPPDLLARGKEISEMERRLKEYEAKAVSCPWCSQDENPVLPKLIGLLADKKRVDWWLAGMPAGWDRHRVDEAMKTLPADAAMKGEGR